jgi:hypothetical protein
MRTTAVRKLRPKTAKPEISTTKARKPNAEKLHKAGLEMETTLSAFEQAKAAFARLVYDAGNREKDTFCKAMGQVLSEWRTWGGRVNLSHQGAMFLFCDIIAEHRHSKKA